MLYGNIMLGFNFSMKKKQKKFFWNLLQIQQPHHSKYILWETNKCIKMYVRNTYCKVVQNNKTIKTS